MKVLTLLLQKHNNMKDYIRTVVKLCKVSQYVTAQNSKDHSKFGVFRSLPQPPLAAYLSSSKLTDNRVKLR